MTPIDPEIFRFDLFHYEVAFEIRDLGFLGRLFTGKEEQLIYYIRQVPKIKVNENEKESVLKWSKYPNSEVIKKHFFGNREDRLPLTGIVYWNNPGSPQNMLTRACVQSKPNQDNVTFSTAYL